MPDAEGSNGDALTRLLTAHHGWVNLEETEATDNRRSLLSNILLSPNLIVLCGLGTTRYLKSSKGTALAPTMKSLWEEIGARQDFENIITITKSDKNTKNIELLLSNCKLWQAIQPRQEVADFITSAEGIIIKKCRFVTSDLTLDRHESFLRKVARRSTRLPRMKLFTTNYDICFERAASRTGFIVADGFSHTSPQEFDGTHFEYDFVRRREEEQGPEYIPNVFHLYKMHGSVDWESRSGSIVRVENATSPLIIYPANSKFESSYSQPFIEMMARFQLSLRQPNTGLLIIGFGFNDDHIAQPILSAIRSNVGLKAAVVNPDLEITENVHLNLLRTLIASGDDRIALLQTTFESLVPTLPDLIAVTEEEEHRRRLKVAFKKGQ